MANESAAEVELEQRIESVVERVLERHLQHLSQPSTEASEPSKGASGGELQSPVWDDESPLGTHQRNRYGHRALGKLNERALSAGVRARAHQRLNWYGRRAITSVPYRPADGRRASMSAPYRPAGGCACSELRGLATISHRLAGRGCPTHP